MKSQLAGVCSAGAMVALLLFAPGSATADALVLLKLGGQLPRDGSQKFDDDPVFGASVGYVQSAGEAVRLGLEGDFTVSKDRMEQGSRHGITTAGLYGTVRTANRLFLKAKLGPAANWARDNYYESEFLLSFGIGAGGTIVNGLSIEIEYARVRDSLYFLSAGICYTF